MTNSSVEAETLLENEDGQVVWWGDGCSRKAKPILCSTLFYYGDINKTNRTNWTAASGSLACDILHIFRVIQLIGANCSSPLLDSKCGAQRSQRWNSAAANKEITICFVEIWQKRSEASLSQSKHNIQSIFHLISLVTIFLAHWLPKLILREAANAWILAGYWKGHSTGLLRAEPVSWPK